MSFPIPDYSAPFKPVPNVTPFTVRDGTTVLKKIDYINKYLTRVLIPWIDENYQGLADNVEEQIIIMVGLVNDAIASVINDSIEVQDPVVAGLVANAASQTRVAMDLVYYTKVAADAKFATMANTYSKSDADAKYRLITDSYTKTQVDGLIDGRASDAELTAEANARVAGDNALDVRLDVLEPLILTGGGRLTQAYLDARYVLQLPAGHMVVVGSSNSTVGTLWPAELATKLGLTVHNYSIGGGAFTSSGGSSFFNQISTAIADTSFPKANVQIVIIADASNDIRGQADVASASTDVFFQARLNYPNARIIVLPAVWSLCDTNMIGNHRASVTRRFGEMTEGAATYDVELIDLSWTWHMDNMAWTEAGKTGGVHLSPAGYTLLKNLMYKFIKHGGQTDRPLGWTFMSAAGGLNPDYMYLRTQRIGNRGYIQGSFQATDLGLDADIANVVNPGYRPMDSVRDIPIQTTNRNAFGSLYFHADSGLLRSWGVLDGSGTETWHVNFSYPIF